MQLHCKSVIIYAYNDLSLSAHPEVQKYKKTASLPSIFPLPDHLTVHLGQTQQSEDVVDAISPGQQRDALSHRFQTLAIQVHKMSTTVRLHSDVWAFQSFHLPKQQIWIIGRSNIFGYLWYLGRYTMVYTPFPVPRRSQEPMMIPKSCIAPTTSLAKSPTHLGSGSVDC